MSVLDPEKARLLNPLFTDYQPPAYIQPGETVEIRIESREQEKAILAAYDYGLDALSSEGSQEIEKLIANLKQAIVGR